MLDLAIPTQGELIPAEELPDAFWKPEERDGRYTAKRFFLQRPDAYKQCIALLAGGAGLLKIARLLGVHHRTVAAVRDAEPDNIDIAKQRIRSNMRLAVEIGAERLPEILETLPNGQVPVALAIAIDKLAQLEGEPTQRLEITLNGKLTHEGVMQELSSFPDVTDAEPAELTGLREAERGQKAVAGGGGDGGGAAGNAAGGPPEETAKPDS